MGIVVIICRPILCHHRMHPPLKSLSKHPLCRDLVLDLLACHETEPWYKKWTGACNEEKWTLDTCLKAQKIFKAKENKKKGDERKERLRKRAEEKRKEEETTVVSSRSG